MATKEDLKDFATKDDMKASEVRILQAVDRIATAFDKGGEGSCGQINCSTIDMRSGLNGSKQKLD